MLNLLPPEIKNQSKVRTKVSNLILAYFFVGALIVLGTAGLFAYNLTLGASIADKQQQVTLLDGQKSQLSATADKLSFIQDRLTQASQYQGGQQWDVIINKVAADTPASVQLTDLKVAFDTTKGNSLSLSGKGTSRRDIVLFQDKLQSEKNLTDVALSAMTTNTDGSIIFALQMGVSK